MFFSSSNRQTTLQESLDRLLLFHKNMITALTWLSSAESKVADLDSIVDASQTIEEQIEMEELHRELSVRATYRNLTLGIFAPQICFLPID